MELLDSFFPLERGVRIVGLVLANFWTLEKCSLIYRDPAVLLGDDGLQLKANKISPLILIFILAFYFLFPRFCNNSIAGGRYHYYWV